MHGTLSFDIGAKNFAYCFIDGDENIIQWAVKDIGANTYFEQCQKLMKVLDTIGLDTMDYDVDVIIERQPSINPRMRVISGKLLMYFALEKESADKDPNYLGRIQSVKLYSPRNKLKVYEPKEGEEPIIVNCKKRYNANKRRAIEQVKRIMTREKYKDWRPLYEKHKSKQDDLADSFLQGLYYTRNKKIAVC